MRVNGRIQVLRALSGVQQQRADHWSGGRTPFLTAAQAHRAAPPWVRTSIPGTIRGSFLKIRCPFFNPCIVFLI